MTADVDRLLVLLRTPQGCLMLVHYVLAYCVCICRQQSFVLRRMIPSAILDQGHTSRSSVDVSKDGNVVDLIEDIFCSFIIFCPSVLCVG